MALGLSVGAAHAAEGGPAGEALRSEARLFSQELEGSGVLSFYEATEGEVRLGRFESALLRYRFLKEQLANRPGYRPLTAVVEQRLDFLKGQMGIAGLDFPPLVPKRHPGTKRRKAAFAPAKEPPAKQAKQAGGPGNQAPGAEAKGKEPQPDSASAPTPPPGLRGGKEEGKPPEDAAPAGRPEGPPPSLRPESSRWQRFRKRLRFWER
jgi:hypothetical protein